ncbi:MAG: energy-coupling factor ABC transporter permease [Thermodesulfovibrionales bacterium]|nr:energy-coupling factor ABC transporter permease [Thermodesulfovibrionales bacterium]
MKICNVKTKYVASRIFHKLFLGRSEVIIITFVVIFLSLSITSDAFAMHIAEGILPLKWALIWYGVAIPFISYGIWKLKTKAKIDLSFKPLVGLLAAVVFIISCMPVPVPTAGTCSHPAGTGITAIILGPAISSVVASVALFIQALFLAHGGISTLGANIVSMGIIGSIAGYAAFRFLQTFRAPLFISGFFAGLLADWATYLMTSFELAAGIRGDSPLFDLMIQIIIAFMPTQIPLGILEGLMTAGVVVLLYKKRPDLLVKLMVLKQREVKI